MNGSCDVHTRCLETLNLNYIKRDVASVRFGFDEATSVPGHQLEAFLSRRPHQCVFDSITVAAGKNPIGLELDAWALGMSIYELLMGARMFDGPVPDCSDEELEGAIDRALGESALLSQCGTSAQLLGARVLPAPCCTALLQHCP